MTGTDHKQGKEVTHTMGGGLSIDQKKSSIEKQWFQAAATGDRSTVRQIHHLPRNLVDPNNNASERIVHVDTLNENSEPLVDGEPTEGWTALIMAAAAGHIKLVQELLIQRSDVNISVPRLSRDRSGTALAHAAERWRRPGSDYKQIVELLLSKDSLQQHSMRNLIESGVSSKVLNEDDDFQGVMEARNFIWSEVQKRDFDGFVGSEGISEDHLSHYSTWNVEV